MCTFVLGIQLQCFSLRPLSNQASLLYLQRALAHLMRLEHDLQALGAWAHPSAGCQAFLQRLSHRLRVKLSGQDSGQCSQIPCRQLFHFDANSQSSGLRTCAAPMFCYALKFHVFPVPHESLGRVIDKQELFKGEQLKWSREWRDWFRKKD